MRSDPTATYKLRFPERDESVWKYIGARRKLRPVFPIGPGPTQWKVDNYARLLVNSDTQEKLKRGDSAEQITRSWAAKLEEFRKARAPFLLY